MPQHPSVEKTTILATYSNRADAEVIKARLADREIDAMIVADDVHPSFQLTEGVKLRVMDREVDRARHILAEETDVSAKRKVGAEKSSESVQQDYDGDFTGDAGVVQATAWMYIAAFFLMVAIILTGLFVGL
jgi:hypothetical protein